MVRFEAAVERGQTKEAQREMAARRLINELIYRSRSDVVYLQPVAMIQRVCSTKAHARKVTCQKSEYLMNYTLCP